jgi:hypothetical protein
MAGYWTFAPCRELRASEALINQDGSCSRWLVDATDCEQLSGRQRVNSEGSPFHCEPFPIQDRWHSPTIGGNFGDVKRGRSTSFQAVFVHHTIPTMGAPARGYQRDAKDHSKENTLEVQFSGRATSFYRHCRSAPCYKAAVPSCAEGDTQREQFRPR